MHWLVSSGALLSNLYSAPSSGGLSLIKSWVSSRERTSLSQMSLPRPGVFVLEEQPGAEVVVLSNHSSQHTPPSAMKVEFY